MQIPARMREHPVESLFAIALLLGLLFAPAERGSVAATQVPSSVAAAKS